MTRHRVVSYNVLSSHLAAADYFPFCDPTSLEADCRFAKLCKTLDSEVKLKSIICLQEVSVQWLARLHPFFVQRRYHILSSNYGDKSCGYMGVMIALCLDTYELEWTDITRIADLKSDDMRSSPQMTSSESWNYVLDCFRLFFGQKDSDYNPWVLANSQPHALITARIRCLVSNDTICVTTYHMPCEYKHPQVMSIHCALAAQRVQSLAGGLPFVFVGDFNILPQSTMYRLLTKGSVEANCPDLPPPLEGDSWNVGVEPMRSAYFVAQGKEPDFTNYAQVRGEEPFINTLDYIFLSKEWEVLRVDPLPLRSDTSGPLPNEREPSDHILIGADILL